MRRGQYSSNRGVRIAALQSLVDGLTKHAGRLQLVVINGRRLTPQQMIDELSEIIALAGDVETMRQARFDAARADLEARRQSARFCSGLRQFLLVVLAGRDDVLADLGLSSRRMPIVTREQRLAAAAKAKVTRLRNAHLRKARGRGQ